MPEIKIHLIHGSTRKNKKSKKSPRLFGLLGGHALIQKEDKIYSFSYNLRIHRLWPRKINKNGKFKIELASEWTQEVSWEKRTTYSVNITDHQLNNFENLVENYSSTIPYDYAFFGERCCSVHYRMLVATQLVKKSKFAYMLSSIPLFYIFFFNKFLVIPVKSVVKTEGCSSRFWM